MEMKNTWDIKICYYLSALKADIEFKIAHN